MYLCNCALQIFVVVVVPYPKVSDVTISFYSPWGKGLTYVRKKYYEFKALSCESVFSRKSSSRANQIGSANPMGCFSRNKDLKMFFYHMKNEMVKNVAYSFAQFAYVQSYTCLFLFGTFDIAIFRPLKVQKSCIPQKKALLTIVWKKFWSWKISCHGRLQTRLSGRGAFSVKVY